MAMETGHFAASSTMSGLESEMLGQKNDNGKPMWSLLPFKAVEEIVKVFDFGAQKYCRHNWVHVDDFENRYLSAALRHMAAYGDGEDKDEESGLYHLAHAGACILFLLWKEIKEKDDNDRNKD